MKNGQKIKYDAGYTDNGNDVILTGYVVETYDDSDDWVFVADTKEDCMRGFGHYIRKCNVISPKRKDVK